MLFTRCPYCPDSVTECNHFVLQDGGMTIKTASEYSPYFRTDNQRVLRVLKQCEHKKCLNRNNNLIFVARPTEFLLKLDREFQNSENGINGY